MHKNDLFADIAEDVSEVFPPNWKHRSYYNFLAISPSYFQIHLYKMKKNPISKIKKIEGYEKVLEIYELFGDVYSNSFDYWWHKTGYQFFEQKHSSNFLFNVDLKKSLSFNQEKLKIYFDKTKSKIKYCAPILDFQKNKIQEDVLRNRLNLILCFIELDQEFKDIESGAKSKNPNWFLAFSAKNKIFGRTASQSFAAIKNAIKFQESKITYIPDKITKKSSNKKVNNLFERPYLKPTSVKATSNTSSLKAKRYLSMLISKNKSEALIVAENAARGIFPCKEKVLKNYQPFDFSAFSSSSYFSRYLEQIQDYEVIFYSTKPRDKVQSSESNSRILELEFEHRLLENIDPDLKKIINKKAEEIYRKKYKKIIDQSERELKLTQRRSVFVRR